MKKIFFIIISVFIMLQLTVFGQTEFINGLAPDVNETEITDGNMTIKASIYSIDGVSYVCKENNFNPVPYDDSLSEIFTKEYIITDKYYIAYDGSNIGAIAGGAYVPFTTLKIYDKQMNLVHEEDFGGGVCVRDVGYCNGTIYCQYTEKLNKINDRYERSYNPYLNRNNPYEKLNNVKVKSTDMIYWEECEEDIPISNSSSCIIGKKISLHETTPTEVLYENSVKYDIYRRQSKLGNWFVAVDENQDEGYIENIYLTNDFVYFIPLDIPQEARDNFIKNGAKNFDIYEYNDNIIVNFKYLKYYLKLPTADIYNKMKQIENSAYVRFKETILGFAQPPIIEDGRTLVPMRFLFEQMGADVDWNPETRTATATLDNTAVTFAIDDTEAEVNSRPVTMDIPAQLVNGKTMVPLRFLSEELGFTVTWDEETRTAVIE